MLTLGLDLQDESLRGTPKRVAKMYVKELFSGLNPENENVNPTILTDWFKRLMQSARSAEHPFNAGLMLEALTADAQQTLHARG